MCGIAGFTVKRSEALTATQLERLTDALLRGIEHRGRDATGMVALSSTQAPVWQKASCDATRFVAHRRRLPGDAATVILHTRFATQGIAEFPENNHPIKRGRFYVVHNGHIWNDAELFAQTKRERAGQVDSEAIAAVLAHEGDLERLPRAMEKLEGAAAVAAVDEKTPGALVIARGEDSPLYWAESKNLVLFASTPEAIHRAHKEAIGTPPKARSMKEGTSLHWTDGPRRKETFALSGWSRMALRTTAKVTKYESGGYVPAKYGDGWHREPLSSKAERMIEDAAGDACSIYYDARTGSSGLAWSAFDECGVCGEYVDPRENTTPATLGIVDAGRFPFHADCAADFDAASIKLLNPGGVSTRESD